MTQDRLTAYRKALNSFDWQYQFSDDHSRYLSGEKDLRKLRKMQRDLDPWGEAWMSTPGAKSHGAPRPEVTQ